MTPMMSPVAQLPIAAVLERINAGERVVFVDTREAAEIAAYRIPHAVHIPLRDVASAPVDTFEGAALVVPYCIKDFRGYEVARALADKGVSRVAILQPFGIRGWRQSGLPVAGDWTGMSDDEAFEALVSCARDGSCLK